jgi:hypothetical protein
VCSVADWQVACLEQPIKAFVVISTGPAVVYDNAAAAIDKSAWYLLSYAYIGYVCLPG